jgi:hypothetical protein
MYTTTDFHFHCICNLNETSSNLEYYFEFDLSEYEHRIEIGTRSDFGCPIKADIPTPFSTISPYPNTLFTYRIPDLT